MPPKPEARARENIDAALEAAGWRVQDRTEVNLTAAIGVAVREYPLKTGFGFADYMLHLDGVAVGVVEAKPEGTTLTGVEVQSEKYSVGLPDSIPSVVRPLPFLYESTGVETFFTSTLDPEPRSRRIFHFHRPEGLRLWLSGAAEGGGLRVAESRAAYTRATLRAGLRNLPPLDPKGLWSVQVRAVENLERSLAEDRPRALIQMATGSGKTYTAVTSIYRLVKFGGAQRVLFLVDRANLGRQAYTEFQQYTPADDNRKFTELYNVQHLTSNKIDPVARVVISTIQRMYSILRGDEDLDEELEESPFSRATTDLFKEVPPLTYNPAVPVETFDVIFDDEAHRSIYNLWRQVLEYFDASIVGLTATPSKQTFGFFNQNLVMEYSHDEAVADGVNVDFEVYRIRTRITEGGSTIDAGYYVDRRDRLTRARRWERLDEDLSYDPSDLDRAVVAEDQIRTVIRAFKERLFTEIFPGRTEVPKTLIYAKDDSHADDIVRIVREEFGKGNDFCQKITYRTGMVRVPVKKKQPDGTEIEEVVYKSAGSLSSEGLLQLFKNSYNPRIAVTVDMIATGTDIRPLEIVMFMRAVQSRTFFEQMKGRGVRVLDSDELKGVTPDAEAKTHFVIVDVVGVAERELSDTQPLERQRTVSFDRLLEAVAFGNNEPDVLSSLASRLSRLDRQLSEPDRLALAETGGGPSLKSITAAIVHALDPDVQAEAARAAAGLPLGTDPTPDQIRAAAAGLMREAAAPIANNPRLRAQMIDLRRRYDQTIDTTSQDEVIAAGLSEEAREKQRQLVESFRAFLDKNREEITALQVLYSRPYAQRLRSDDIRRLAEAIHAPANGWNDERLWQAYKALERDRVRGAPLKVATDVVALVRYALDQDDALLPFPETVERNYERWLAGQRAAGSGFSAEQRWWLDAVKDHIARSFAVELADFDLDPFVQRGGAGKAYQLFRDDLEKLLDELNRELVA